MVCLLHTIIKDFDVSKRNGARAGGLVDRQDSLDDQKREGTPLATPQTALQSVGTDGGGLRLCSNYYRDTDYTCV